MVSANVIVSLPCARGAAPHRLVIAGACLSAIGCTLQALSGGRRSSLFIAGTLVYASGTFLSPVLRAMLIAVVAPGTRAQALGAAAAVESVTALISPPVFGALADVLGGPGLEELTYLFAAIFFTAMVPIMLHGRPHVSLIMLGLPGEARHHHHHAGARGEHEEDDEAALHARRVALARPLLEQPADDSTECHPAPDHPPSSAYTGWHHTVNGSGTVGTSPSASMGPPCDTAAC
mmetsp:Transcript_11344/g.27605  ORF Transcript_11344/g.27605 Transcript_11344/m.27605 type:complete len:234 (-) Transcript_11344:103-804(-)